MNENDNSLSDCILKAATPINALHDAKFLDPENEEWYESHLNAIDVESTGFIDIMLPLFLSDT